MEKSVHTVLIEEWEELSFISKSDDLCRWVWGLRSGPRPGSHVVTITVMTNIFLLTSEHSEGLWWPGLLHSFSPECRDQDCISSNWEHYHTCIWQSEPRPIRGQTRVTVTNQRARSYRSLRVTRDHIGPAINCKQRRDQGTSCLNGPNEPWNTAV